MQISSLFPIALLLGSFGVPASAAQWDIDADFPSINTVGSAWRVGYLIGDTFTRFPSHVFADIDYWYDASGVSGAQGWQSYRDYFDFGINPGEVSLNSDTGIPEIRWIAPNAGRFAIDVEMGGSTASGPHGYGNRNVTLSGVRVNGVEMTGKFHAAANVKVWHLIKRLAQGAKVAVYVNQHYDGGNTQTRISITQTDIGEEMDDAPLQ